MVVRRSAGRKVGAMFLEGEALKARKSAFQAVIALSGSRFDDTFFPTIVAAVAGFPLVWHLIKAGIRGSGRRDNRGDRSSGGGRGTEEAARPWTGRGEVEAEVDGFSSWWTEEAGRDRQTGQ